MMTLVKLSEYFEIYNGLAKSNFSICHYKINNNCIAYIRPAKSYDSSLDGYIDKSLIQKENIFPSGTIYISTDGEGSHSYSYVSCFEFVPNSNVIALIPTIELSLVEKLFYANCITMNRYKFSYSRKPKKNRIKDILIPSKNSIPAFVYNKNIKTITKESLINNKVELNIKHWGKFALRDLFDIIKGERLTKVNQKTGNTPLVMSSSINNGVASYIDFDYFSKIKSIHNNTITIDMFCNVFYHEYDYFSDDNIHTLILKEDKNKFVKIFLVQVLKKLSSKYNYGRQVRLKTLYNEKIKLPIDKNSNPDWEFMENYIKSLPYSKNLEH
jgi:hypothetical protein